MGNVKIIKIKKNLTHTKKKKNFVTLNTLQSIFFLDWIRFKTLRMLFTKNNK